MAFMKIRQRDSNTANQPMQSDDGIGDTLVEMKGRHEERKSRVFQCRRSYLRAIERYLRALAERRRVPLVNCRDIYAQS